MTVKKDIILIPYWIQETLQRNQLPLAACLDFAKIKPIMALSDLTAFAALDEFQKQIIGIESNTWKDIVWHWSGSIPNTDPTLKDFLWNTVNSLSKDRSLTEEVKARLFDSDARTSQYKNAFITYDLSPTVAGVVIYPGFFVSEGIVELQKPLIDSLLKLLYVYEPSHEVAKTPLFKRYLELLALQKH